MKNVWIFIILMFVSVPLMAQSNSDPSAEDCGMEGDEVIPFDSTICQDDKAWSIMTNMLPDLFEDAGDIVALEIAQVPETPEITLGVASVLQKLYGFMFDVSLWVMALVLGVYATDLVARYLRSGRAMYYQGYSAGKMATGAMTGVGLLLPYQTMYLGQAFIFSLSLAAPGLANMAHSAFLAQQQAQFAATHTATITQATGAENAGSVFARHDYQAREFYNYLAYMEMCRRLSSAQLLSDNFRAGEPILPQWDCLHGQTDLLETNNTFPSFLRPASNALSPVNLPLESYSTLSNVSFGWKLNEFEKCDALNTVITSYSCGGIRFSAVRWEESPYTNALEDGALKEVLDNINEQVRAGVDPAQISTIAQAGWQRLYDSILNDAIADVTTVVDDTNSVLNVYSVNEAFEEEKRKEALEKIYRSKNQDILKKFAGMYYRAVMNGLYIGHEIADDQGGFEDVALEQMSFHYQQAQALADKLEMLYCIEAKDSRGDSEAAKRLVESDGLSNSKAHFRCLSKDSNEVVGIKPIGPDEDRDAYGTKVVEIVERTKQEYLEAMTTAAKDLADLRVAVEASYIQTIKSFEEPNIAKQLRQEGFLSVAHYAFKMSKMYEDTREGVRYVVNHYELMPNQITSSGLSLDVLLAMGEEPPQYSVFGLTDLMSDAQSTLKSDPIVMPVSFVNSVAVKNESDTIRDDGLDDMMLSMSMVFTGGFFDEFGSYGLSNYRLVDDNTKEACMADVSRCPFPVKDPFVSLNLLGHDMVNAGTQMLVMSLGAKLIQEIAGRRNATLGGETSRKPGSLGKKAALAGAATGSYYLLDAIASEAVGSLFDEVNVPGAEMLAMGAAALIATVSAELNGVIFMISLMVTLLGSLLAYVMPLIPLIFVYYNFIAWLCIVVMASFAVFLFAIYLFRANEQASMLNKTMINYGVQIMFRLVFQYVALIFAWYLFFATTYFISNTFGYVLPTFDDGGLVTFVSTLIAWLMVAFVFFFGVTMSFNVVEELTGEMFRKMGLDYKDNKDKMSEVIKAVLFDQVESAGEQLKEKITGKRNPKSAENQQKYQQAASRLKAMGQ